MGKLYVAIAAVIGLVGAVFVVGDVWDVVIGGLKGSDAPYLMEAMFTGIGALIGFGLLALAAINLLNQRYGAIAPALRITAAGFDLLLTALVLLLLVSDSVFNDWQGWLLGGLAAAMVPLALRRGRSAPAATGAGSSGDG